MRSSVPRIAGRWTARLKLVTLAPLFSVRVSSVPMLPVRHTAFCSSLFHGVLGSAATTRTPPATPRAERSRVATAAAAAVLRTARIIVLPVTERESAHVQAREW